MRKTVSQRNAYLQGNPARCMSNSESVNRAVVLVLVVLVVVVVVVVVVAAAAAAMPSAC